MHHYRHHHQLFDGGLQTAALPGPQYQYPAAVLPQYPGYILQTHVVLYPYLTPIISPGFTNLQTPVPDSLEPRNTNGDDSAASSSNTKLKRKKSYQSKDCSHEGCTNKEVRGGVCIRPGAKKKKKSYKHEGCTNQAKKGGVCIRHGAKMKKKTCSHEGLLA